MSFNKKNLVLLGLLIISVMGVIYGSRMAQNNDLPLVAIASFGPHSSLEDAIRGTKEELNREGFAENKQIRFETVNVNFQPTLIPQMLATLQSHQPKVMVVLNTPVAQVAKKQVKNIPIVFSAITDPVGAGLLKAKNKADAGITGVTDTQDIGLLLKFAQTLLPNAKTVGLLYSTAESNDMALLKMVKDAATEVQMHVMAIPIDQTSEIPTRMQAFRGKVDFIYVGTSGPIQPALPAIVAEADKMKIPVFNADSNAVHSGQVLGSMGVNYYQVGVNAGKIVARLLRGEDVADITPVSPQAQDHQGFVCQKRAKALDIEVPAGLENVTVVD